ncbi:tRNA (guanine(37)-N1)-methyltransferase [Polypterus senegalus]|nr:tRNA (guanine(37)-N1)-methyltransferase [Polypterus senegalus]
MWRFCSSVKTNQGTVNTLLLSFTTNLANPAIRKLFSVHTRSRFAGMLPAADAKYENVDLYAPPAFVRGMTKLNREAFKKSVSVPALRVKKEIINKLMKSLKSIALQRPGVKRVVEDPTDEDHKLVLLDPYKISPGASFGELEKNVLKEHNVSIEIHKYNLEMTYENFKCEEILRAVLPEGQDVTSGFSRVGHIAHMNLREHQLPYKHLIGDVIIDKNPGVTSVVNKMNTIDSTYRNFQMEVLAGLEDMVAKVRENNVTYEFDFSKVYWNPRLSTEHERIVQLLKSGDLVFDVFAGVGPFAIPAAKKKCIVFANDLNPESHKWLQHNCKLNKVDQRVNLFNLDGRDFITNIVKGQLAKLLNTGTEQNCGIHIIMNLPALAVQFLDAFKNLLEEPDTSKAVLPHIHCYSFSKHDDPAEDVMKQAEDVLNCELRSHCSVHLVRNVAPNKEMVCITFQIPREVIFQKQKESKDVWEEPESKRLKTSNIVSEDQSVS